ncbi:hypothetical protein NBO_41g0002 [Nosema bombycis CQ1]|uniref:Uncharacterized protein n=1 Tax=Nosema bombycis (strain CQ1 / CVCC 102059) TaxID=578461 RepID=R0KT95_NOSB1|nr:hypothetical protein NBO_41g0002 [Nosema bombycis CQ1]|eukprot:EOB14026.1 hypothetical protein NBO_41g0002 [Nosema bombycis CQ1]
MVMPRFNLKSYSIDYIPSCTSHTPYTAISLYIPLTTPTPIYTLPLPPQTTTMPNLSKFRNLNIKTYLNDILPQFEKSILISDLNFIEKIRKEFDTEIFKSFLLNSDSLLEVLYTYESVKSNLNYLEDIKNDLKINKESENNGFIDFNKLEEFRNVLRNFTSEVDSYDTGSRILIHFDIFLDENDNKNIFLLTNDILIIGKIDSRTRKYQLVNAYSYLIVDIKIKEDVNGDQGGSGGSNGVQGDEGGSCNGDGYQGDDRGAQVDNRPPPHNPPHVNSSFLYVVLSKSFTKFKGNKKSIDKFYSIFKDLNYNYEDFNENKKKDKNKNELIEFLIETEQYKEIEKYKESKDYDNLNIYNLHSLNYLKSLCNNSFIFDFLLRRFKSILGNVNKVKPFKDLIDYLFDEIFKKFRKEQEEIVNVNFNYLLLLEKEILMIFKIIESRILNDSNLLKDKLLFDQYDFTYLTDYFNKKKKYHQEERYKEAKKEIDSLIREMVSKM